MAQDFRITHGDAAQKLLPTRTNFAIVSFIKLGFKAFLGQLDPSIRDCFSAHEVFFPFLPVFVIGQRIPRPAIGTKFAWERDTRSFLSVSSSLSNQGGNSQSLDPPANKSWAIDFVIFCRAWKHWQINWIGASARLISSGCSDIGITR